MDAEQFKQLMEVVSELSGDAKHFGLWYLAVYAVQPLVIGLAVLLVLRGLVGGVQRFLSTENAARRIGRELYVCRSFSNWTDRDTAEAVDKAHDLLQSQKQQSEHR